jgi:hypothetical protein
VSKNITTGVTATTFQPGKTMTRQEMASFIYRYYNSPAVTGSLTYSDAASVASWAVSAVNYCTAQKPHDRRGHQPSTPPAQPAAPWAPPC